MSESIVWNVVVNTTSKGASAAKRRIQGVFKSLGETNKAAKNAAKEMDRFAVSNKRTASSSIDASKSITAVSGSLNLLQSSFRSASHGAEMFSNALGVGVSLSLVGATKHTVEWNRELFASRRIFSLYGESFKTLSDNIDGLGERFKFTRKEALELRKTFAMGFIAPDLSTANDLFATLSKVVGVNEKEINKLLGTMSGISKVLPEFEGLVRGDFSKGPEKSAKAMARYQKILSMAVISGKISNEQYKEMASILKVIQNSDKKLTGAEKRKRKEADDLLKAQAKIAKLFDDIQISVGEKIIPYLEKGANYLDEWKDTVINISSVAIPLIEMIGVTIASLAIFKGLKGLKGLASGGGKGGLAETLGSITTPIPVYVVNDIPGMEGMGGKGGKAKAGMRDAETTLIALAAYMGWKYGLEGGQYVDKTVDEECGRGAKDT